MKNFYKAGGVLCLLPATPLQLFSIFTRRAFSRFLPCCIFLLLFGPPDARSQSPEKQEAVSGGGEVRALKVGEKVSEEFWKKQHIILENGETKVVNLQHSKGKPLLLDFWATWCASCIKRFPQLDTLRTKYRNELKILLVNSVETRDTHETVKSHWNANVKELRLPTILGDQYITQLFPRYAIPYYIWIDRNGRVTAMTSSLFINEKVIESFLANE